MPVKVRTHAPNGDVCEEEGLMQDVCSGGMAFRARMPLRRGQVVHLSAPVPRSMRDYGKESAAYQVYAIVRNILVDDDGCRVGVMFFGQEPPRGYARNPRARFLLPKDIEGGSGAPERTTPKSPVASIDWGGQRNHERYDTVVELELLYVDEWGMLLDRERTVAENVSLGGARVLTTHRFAVGSVIQLREVGGSFEGRALIVGSHVGPKQVRRLNLKFLDGRRPVHLLPQH
jgi:hypothetical protein